MYIVFLICVLMLSTPAVISAEPLTIAVSREQSSLSETAMPSIPETSAIKSKQNSMHEPKRICPITCKADSEGWTVIFECEAGNQEVTMTYYEDFKVALIDGKPNVYGDVGFKFESSGKSYRVAVNVKPCQESNTGYCIKGKTAGTISDARPSKCQNY